MTKTTVTPKRVREIIAAYGADPARWPAAERTAALAILRDDAELSAFISPKLARLWMDQYRVSF